MKTINIRILEHDLQDNIRIGATVKKLHTAETMANVESFVKNSYNDKLSWCGGYDMAMKKYYKRVAIVEADSLKVARIIFEQ